MRKHPIHSWATTDRDSISHERFEWDYGPYRTSDESRKWYSNRSHQRIKDYAQFNHKYPRFNYKGSYSFKLFGILDTTTISRIQFEILFQLFTVQRMESSLFLRDPRLWLHLQRELIVSRHSADDLSLPSPDDRYQEMISTKSKRHQSRNLDFLRSENTYFYFNDLNYSYLMNRSRDEIEQSSWWRRLSSSCSDFGYISFSSLLQKLIFIHTLYSHWPSQISIFLILHKSDLIMFCFFFRRFPIC